MPTATAADPATPTGGAASSVPLVERARRIASRPAAAGSTVFFRISFGLIVSAGALRFLAHGWVESLYLAPAHHLTYPGFGWVRPLPPPLMYAHVVGLGALGLVIASGRRTGLAAGLFVIGFAYVELIDAALYLNHYWYVTLVGVLLIVLPMPAGGTVPVITVWALRAQLAVVYVFAGFAKVNPDWLLRGEPMHIWLQGRTELPIVGPWLDEPAVAVGTSWAGMLFDTTIVVWLLWPRTRPVAYAAVIAFHAATAVLFPQIGIFPLVMICGALIFFPPSWPSALADRFGLPAWRRFRPGAPTRRRTGTARTVRCRTRVGGGVLAVLLVIAVVEVALPLRHYAAPGNVRWNDDGYYLSWRVMLTERVGFLEFEVTDPRTGVRYRVDPASVLAEWQVLQAEARPDLALAAAHLVRDDFARRGMADVEVRADSFVAFNGRLRQRQIDPTVDLARLGRAAPASDYVLSLGRPVRP